LITIHLLPHAEKLAPKNPLRLERQPLYHQQRTLEALQKHDLVVNTYNTGTGKTVASLLNLFELDGTGKNVLFIAPTNALLSQHTEDIQDFVRRYNLRFHVQKVTAADVRVLRLAQTPEATPTRPGEVLQRLIRNYVEFQVKDSRRLPIVLVINPDIFYYALYFRYAAHDRRNIFERFLTAFDYVIIDEFHYYDSKQLANFLFAFALFDQFGYFENGRKVCLLSATPTEAVCKYLDRLFGDRWALVAPDNEPPESAGLDTAPALAPLRLTAVADSIESWVAVHRGDLIEWVVHNELDGALISSSLWRVNACYDSLRGVLSEDRIGRITGPEPPAQRTLSTGRDLILATPTVDIGYNFHKLSKLRQNIDFVICDARHGDELLQRIGRAGRVLGKESTTESSRAVVLLSPDAVQALAVYDGQTLDRHEFALQVRDCTQLPAKHSLHGYIHSYAITESFWPIYQMGQAMPHTLQTELDALFERVRSVFCPNSKRSFGGLGRFFRKLSQREHWLHATRNGIFPRDLRTAQQVVDWLTYLDPTTGSYAPADILALLNDILAEEAQRRDLRAFVQSQVAITRALFSFRDSFQGPRAVVYDPAHYLSSQTVNAYDLFHLVCNYELSPPLTRDQFLKFCGETDMRDDFYFRLIAPRRPRLILDLVYDSSDIPEDFERKWVGRPVALSNVRLQARERDSGAVIVGALDGQIVNSLTEQYLPMLIIPPDSVGAMISCLRGMDLWSRRLTVRFPDGRIEDGYHALLGIAAFHAHAELQRHFLLRDRLQSDAIII